MPVNCATMLDRCGHLLERGSEPAATRTMRSLMAAHAPTAKHVKRRSSPALQ